MHGRHSSPHSPRSPHWPGYATRARKSNFVAIFSSVKVYVCVPTEKVGGIPTALVAYTTIRSTNTSYVSYLYTHMYEVY